MQPVIMRRLPCPYGIPGKLLSEATIFCIPGRSMQFNYNSTDSMHKFWEELLTKEPPLLTAVMEWSRYYYDQSSKICQKYYKENVMVTLEGALKICSNSVRQSNLEWHTERLKRITGTSCTQLFKHGTNSNLLHWQARLDFATRAKNFPMYLTRASSHGLAHEKAARRRYSERMKGYTVLDLGLVVNPKIPFLGFSPDGVVLDKNGKALNLIEIKCPVDGRVFSSEDLLRVATFIDEEGSLKKDYKYYNQVQLGMFVLGLPYCDFIIYSSSESDYTKRRIEFNEVFVKNMMRRLVQKYFCKILPWLTRKNIGVAERPQECM